MYLLFIIGVYKYYIFFLVHFLNDSMNILQTLKHFNHKNFLGVLTIDIGTV